MVPPLILLGQKAQRYDEALKKARKELQACGSYDCDAARQIFRLFPELKKSEGERIRKAISDILLIDSDEIREILEANDLFMQDIDAWLEKQSEQNNNEDADILYRFSFYSYKDEPNVIYLSGFYVNEEYRNKGIGTKILEVADEVTKSLDCHAIRLKTKKDSDAERLYQTHGYNSLSTEGKDEIWLEKQAEQKPTVETKLKIEKGKWYICISQFCNCIEGRTYKAISDSRLVDDFGTEYDMHSDAYKYFRLWTIQDAKDGDVLVDEDNNIGIHKEIEGLYWNSYIYLGCDGKLRGFSIGGSHKQANTRPATKKQHDLLFQKMHEAGYEWDAEKKELKKVEQNPTKWSEEDEKEVAVLEAYIRSKDWSERHIDRALGIVDELVNKVKSLKPQKQWKPSSEQIATIEYIIKEYESTTIHLYDGAAKQLYSLLEQLKQL